GGSRIRLLSQATETTAPAPLAKEERHAREIDPKKAIPREKLLGMPLSRWRWEQAKRVPESEQLDQLVGSLAEAIKAVASFTRVSGVPDYREEWDKNSIYESMGKGWRHNDVCKRLLEVALCASGRLGVVAYPNKPPMTIDEVFGHFIATVNPLVGAGGLDANVPTGTVIGLFEEPDDEGCIVDYNIDDASLQEELCLLRTLQPGKNLIGAGYAIYSGSCELVLAVKGQGVHGFTLDSSVGEFILTKPYMRIPSRGSGYSLDESRRDTWPKALQEHIDKLRSGEGQSGKKFGYRLVGSAVADVHRTLVQGGIWGRPDTDAGSDQYGGDRTGGLTVLGESSPLAFIVEEAGGRAVDGHGERVLDIYPETLRQKTGLFLGGEEDILELERALEAGSRAERETAVAEAEKAKTEAASAEKEEEKKEAEEEEEEEEEPEVVAEAEAVAEAAVDAEASMEEEASPRGVVEEGGEPALGGDDDDHEPLVVAQKGDGTEKNEEAAA
ncbi:unnamed protein product, partial [Ectocarpus sp. 13 AM-2016]